jgi:hypothetical protein
MGADVAGLERRLSIGVERTEQTLSTRHSNSNSTLERSGTVLIRETRARLIRGSSSGRVCSERAARVQPSEQRSGARFTKRRRCWADWVLGRLGAGQAECEVRVREGEPVGPLESEWVAALNSYRYHYRMRGRHEHQTASLRQGLCCRPLSSSAPSSSPSPSLATITWSASYPDSQCPGTQPSCQVQALVARVASRLAGFPAHVSRPAANNPGAPAAVVWFARSASTPTLHRPSGMALSPPHTNSVPCCRPSFSVSSVSPVSPTSVSAEPVKLSLSSAANIKLSLHV